MRQPDFEDFQRAFTRASQNVGLQIDCAHRKTWVTDQRQAVRNVWNIDYDNIDDRVVRQSLTTWRGQKATIILVLLPSAHTALYAAIKRIGDFMSPSSNQQDTSIATICMLTHKIRAAAQGRSGYLANIQLKFNVKAQYGTINHKIEATKGSTQLPRLLGAKTMLVGMDVVSEPQQLYTFHKYANLLDSSRYRCNETSS